MLQARLPPPQDRIDRAQEHGARHQRAHRIRDRLGIERRFRAEIHGQQEREREHDHEFAEQRKRDRDRRDAEGGEPVHKHVLKGERDDRQRIDADKPHGERLQRLVPREDGDKGLRKELRGQKHHEGEQNCEKQNPLLSLLDPLHSARPVIIAQDGLRTGGDSPERHRDDLHKGEHDGGSGDIEIPVFSAVTLQHAV